MSSTLAKQAPRDLLTSISQNSFLLQIIQRISDSFRKLSWVIQLILHQKGRNLSTTLASTLRSILVWLSLPIRYKRLRDFKSRFFELRRWHIVLAGAISARAGAWVLQRACTWGATRLKARKLYERMETADTYDEWSEAAAALDALENRKLPLHPAQFTWLQARTAKLRQMLEIDDVHGLMWALRQDTSRNVGSLLGTAAEQGRVHSVVPPQPITEYIEAIQQALHHVCHCRTLKLEDRLAFVRELRHAYGRTGLVLSGGGSFGHFHFGVNRALLHAGLLPRVMSGSSAGAIGVAMVCTRTDAELLEHMDTWSSAPTDFFGAPKGVRGTLRHFFTKWTLHSSDEYAIRLQRLMGDLTFQEAYARSGRVCNIAVTPADSREPCRVLNYLTAPNVLVWSAVACSSAFPLLFAPQELLAKDASGRVVPFHGSCTPEGTSDLQSAGTLRRWADGSLEEDLPMRGLGEMFGVNYFLVSQCNPWLVPVLAGYNLLPRRLAHLAELELKLRCGQLLKLWPRSKLLKIVCQPWLGDLNFILPVSAFPIARSAVNFTPAEIVQAMQEGQRAVWAKLPAIRAGCAVEVTVDAELRALTLQQRALRRREEHVAAITSRGRASFPSWMDLKSLGLGGSESSEDMRSLGVRTPRGSTDRLHSGEFLLLGGGPGAGAGSRPGSRVGITEEVSSGVGLAVEENEDQVHGYDEMEQMTEPWEVGHLMGGGGSGGNGHGGGGAGGGARPPEGGLEALRDLTVLTMGAEGLDFIAP